MNEDILKLAKECGMRIHYDEMEGVEAFYRAAFNQGLEAAAKCCTELIPEYTNTFPPAGNYMRHKDDVECANAIRKLRMKP